MEYVEGTTLNALMYTARPSRREWVWIGAEITDALDFAHPVESCIAT